MFLVLAVAGIPFAYDGPLAPSQTLTIRDINGGVHVRSGEKLSIRATKTAKNGDPNAVAIKVEQRRGGTIVCVRYPPNADRGCDDRSDARGANDNDTQVDFEVTLPRGAGLDANTVNGGIEARTDGTIAASTVNGGVHVEGRDVRSVHTVNGSITVRAFDRPARAVEARTVNGSIEISLPPGTGVSLSAHTLTGNIDASGLNVDRPRYGPGATASGTLGDGAVRVALETVNGSITLRR
jgi:hypothetical protein